MTNFTDTFTSLNFTNEYISSIESGDFDGDGDLDLLANGLDSRQIPFAKIYTNDGLGSFREDPFFEAGDLDYSSGSIGDYDGDGDIDLLMMGYDDSNQIVSIYKNDGSGAFDRSTLLKLFESEYGYARMEDYDGDLDLDLLVTGFGDGEFPFTRMYDNDGSGNFSENFSVEFNDVLVRNIASGDYDNDGENNLLITGVDSNFNPIAKTYENDESGNFIEAPFISLNSFNDGVTRPGFVKSEDYDGDGNLDLLITSSEPNYNFDDLELFVEGFERSYTSTVKIYTNDDSGNFEEDFSFDLNDALINTVTSEDFDNDGDLDLIITGDDSQDAPFIKLYGNDGSGSFSENTFLNFDLDDVSIGTVTAGDYDGDRDIDLLITNRNSFTKLYSNNAISTGDNSENDRLVGTDEGNNLDGGAGNDVIYGKGGHDLLFGGEGDDRLHGQSGRDTLDGGAGNDTLFGGNKFDRLNGGEGDDMLDGGRGTTVYTGGDGDDMFIFDDDSRVDWVRDFELDRDRIGLPDSITFDRLSISGKGNSIIEYNGDRLGVLIGVKPDELIAEDFVEV